MKKNIHIHIRPARKYQRPYRENYFANRIDPSTELNNTLSNSVQCIVDVDDDPPLPPHRHYSHIYIGSIDPCAIKNPDNINVKVAEIIKSISPVEVTIRSERKLSEEDIAGIKIQVAKHILKEGGIPEVEGNI